MLASTAGAEPSADRAKALELFEDGRRLMNSHDPVGACAKFTESIRLEPLAAGTMLNLGLCHQQLGHYKTALYWFRKAQIRATETDPPLPAYEQEARDHTTHLAPLVATIKVVVPADEADVQVTIDDEPIRPEDYAHVEIDPGHHVLVATAPDKPAFRRELDIKGKGGKTVRVVFGEVAPEPPPPEPPPAVTPPPVVEVDTGPPRKRIAIYLASGGATLLCASLGVTLYEKHVYNSNKDAAMRGDAMALDSTRSATEIARDYGTGLAVLGLVAGGVATYLFVTASDEPVAITPVVAPGQAGAVVMGRF